MCMWTNGYKTVENLKCLLVCFCLLREMSKYRELTCMLWAGRSFSLAILVPVSDRRSLSMAVLTFEEQFGFPWFTMRPDRVEDTDFKSGHNPRGKKKDER